MIDPRVQSLCDEFEVRIVPKSAYPGPGETRAVGTLQKIISRQGMEHARLVMTTLAETENNKASLDQAAFGAASGLIRARPADVEDASKWLAVWDATPVGELQWISQDLRGVFPLNAVLAGMIYERVWRAFGPRSIQPDLLDDRRRT
ncbi:hypothetical protein EDC40_103667 [Aminobacter aminovorans]|uniref:Uncharacterized protein n=1 Tax=Aminobacter aminovorans TaxID=83263 RepID=A0A380WKD6_AMIAI|nr:hypothetical protein [Aminobacter aminovorans]TCS28198.1 hypothetical protein EDC40_103667 [Aminobacter aminovorans]SUU89391.1 Uncharacterised protein [Aminobacter aminovorans]